MFDKERFADILKRIISEYYSISEFAKISSLDRSYISKCINKKLENPPSPNILRKIANNSNYKIDYISLMYICGYLTDDECGYCKNGGTTNRNEFNSSTNLNYIQYVRLDETGQKKVNDYITDLTDTKKYKKIY